MHRRPVAQGAEKERVVRKILALGRPTFKAMSPSSSPSQCHTIRNTTNARESTRRTAVLSHPVMAVASMIVGMTTCPSGANSWPTPRGCDCGCDSEAQYRMTRQTMTVIEITIHSWRWPHVDSRIYVRNTGHLHIKTRAVQSLRCGAPWKTLARLHKSRVCMKWSEDASGSLCESSTIRRRMRCWRNGRCLCGTR